MTDAIIGAQYIDHTFDRKFEVVGTYERPIRDDSGAVVDTEVVVDCLYENADDPTRVELQNFKTDPGIELVETPEWF